MESKTHSPPNVLDLFAGCGGLSLGLSRAGMRVGWANESWIGAAGTLQRAHPRTHVLIEDAKKLFCRTCEGEPGTPQAGQVDVLAGGPPCQGFSGYNRYRRPSDPRNSLIDVFLDFVLHLRPRHVLMENVPGILSMSDGQVIESLLKALQEFGYRTQLGILQAGHYGLPQNRWRVFVLAARDGERLVSFPTPTHLFHRTTIFGAKNFRDAVIAPPNESTLFWDPSPTVTVGDAISDLPPICNGEGDEVCAYQGKPQSRYQRALRNGMRVVHDHVCAHLGPVMMERVQAVPKRPGAGWADLPDHLKPNNLAKHGDRRYDNRFGRLHWEGTFNTVLTKPEPYWGRVIHPEQDRVLSVRECARAQGFPDSVRFFGSVKDKYKQIGNAVPPILAEAIGRKIMEAIDLCNEGEH